MRIAAGYIPSFDESQLPILNTLLFRIVQALNNIEFGNGVSNENVWCDFQTVTTPGTSGTPFYQAHNLTRKPIGVIPIWQNNAGIFYAVSGSAHTASDIYLQCSTASCSAVLLII